MKNSGTSQFDKFAGVCQKIFIAMGFEDVRDLQIFFVGNVPIDAAVIGDIR